MISALTELIPPPKNPENSTGDWAAAENQIGVEFPTDFKQLIASYGTGQFPNSLTIRNPVDPWGVPAIEDDLDRYEELSDALELNLPLHPRRPGLLPWGQDSNGHLYCWWTDGEPDAWPVIQLFHGDEENPTRADASVTRFLVEFLENKHPDMLGGSRFDRKDLRFSPGLPWRR